MSQKFCQCIKGPEISQQRIPQGFVGRIICGRCHGIADLPRSTEKYKGTDPVEEYLFEVGKNTIGLTFETAILTILLRIEKALTGQVITGTLEETIPTRKGRH
jgi:hypothetical protein